MDFVPAYEKPLARHGQDKKNMAKPQANTVKVFWRQPFAFRKNELKSLREGIYFFTSFKIAC